MSKTARIAARIDPEVDQLLDRLADETGRSKSHHVNAALRDYVERELEIAAAVREGIRQAKAGMVVPHEEVMSGIRAKIADALARHKASD
ncbi:MAG: CopG family ribbon-helix-helix protein [Sphingomonadales bacterium]